LNNGIDIPSIVEEAVSKKPWLTKLEDEKSDLAVMMNGASKNFNNR
jgi:hypothetical protein